MSDDKPDAKPDAKSDPIAERPAVIDELKRADSQAPWWAIWLRSYVVNLWDWLTGILSLVGSALPLISEWVDQHPEYDQWMSTTERHYFSFALMFAIFVFNILSIIKKAKQ